MVYGATDDFGFKAVEKPVRPTCTIDAILYLLGIEPHQADPAATAAATSASPTTSA